MSDHIWSEAGRITNQHSLYVTIEWRCDVCGLIQNTGLGPTSSFIETPPALGCSEELHAVWEVLET